MATEILFLDLTREPTVEELETCFDDVIPLPRGFRTAIFGQSRNDLKTVVGFLSMFTGKLFPRVSSNVASKAWDKVESQYTFENSQLFPKFVKSLTQFGNCPFRSFYVYFEQGLPHPVLRSPLIELIMVEQRQDISPNQMKHLLAEYMGIASGYGLRSYFYGHRYQDPTFFVMLLGWESKESQESDVSSLALDRLMREITMTGNKSVRHIVVT